MKIPSIYVGCGPFGIQRLEVLIKNTNFIPVACVDINYSRAKKNLSESKTIKKLNLNNKIYKTINDAIKNHDAKACFIFATGDQHCKLIKESLKNNLHTYCVKPIAINQKEFREIIKLYKLKKKLMFLQGYNNQWNEAAQKMKEWMTSKKGIGKMIGGECLCWGRQNLKTNPTHLEVKVEGLFFLTLACHQLSQLVFSKGLPKYVTSYVHKHIDKDIGQLGVFGTSGGQCIFEYSNSVPFSYTGTRAAHSNPFGFASRWSGQWLIHGKNGDIKREGGRLTLFRKGGTVEDIFLKDLDINLLEDERIQFDEFYKSIIYNKKRKYLNQHSFDTWILMEACNESAKKNIKIDINKFKKKLIS